MAIAKIRRRGAPDNVGKMALQSAVRKRLAAIGHKPSHYSNTIDGALRRDPCESCAQTLAAISL